MKIISWNVNGIRALEKKGQFNWLLSKGPDVFCLQETKARAEQLDESLLSPAGYFSFFSSHEEKKGYSGTALYSKKEPDRVDHGIGIKEFDNEGRMVIATFGKTIVANVYFPNGGGGPERLDYKLRFYDAFLEYCLKKQEQGYELIIAGDVNTAHEEIDLARAKENEKNTGFLPEERAWIDEVIRNGFADAFRSVYPNRAEAYTYWDQKTYARERNVGWRIDYFLVTQGIKAKIKDVVLHTDVKGSDHCPIELVLKDTL
ncbi:MAG: exodeoxyribonuclease III [Candidatus Campbellbacteria bacterium]|nr:exodeoxyribonuclease III [Candidatus Campbellbacteria bacterium]